MSSAPISIELSEEQLAVVNTRGCPMQVIACAGSGKTESISRRVAALIEEDELPESIIAFTFTEKAAAELKNRIYRRIEEIKGKDFLGRLGLMFVGTIHSYCFHLLQDYVPQYGNYEVLDEHQHLSLLSREYQTLGLKKLGSEHWKSIRDFAKTADIITNELIDPQTLLGTTIGGVYQAYENMLAKYRFLTFGLIISQAIKALSDSLVYKRVRKSLKHLLVDEYQDINPAQERLIELLAAPPIQLCVVGDDDQSIYQWRGSDISNILDFANRYTGTKTIKLEINRRSRPTIISVANFFAQSIPNRLDKKMRPSRDEASVELVTWAEDTENLETKNIVATIKGLRGKGYQYRDIGILYRSVRTSAPPLIRQLEEQSIPYQCGGRTGLFLQPEINLFGEIFAWFVDENWKDEKYGEQRPSDIDYVVNQLIRYFRISRDDVPGLKKYLEDWRSFRLRGNRSISLVGDFYKLLKFLKVDKLDVNNSSKDSYRFGAFARFSTILADFEHINRRGSFVIENGKKVFRAGLDRGKSYYRKLHNYLLHYARDAYEDFEGEQMLDVDAVSILTIHQAKGLEWPIVFIPAMTSRRFPSIYAGTEQKWLLPESVFPVETRKRYEGGDAEERRLFYVAITRARDAVYISYFKNQDRQAKPSPYLTEIGSRVGGIQSYSQLPLPKANTANGSKETQILDIGFSDLANFDECGYRYRLSRVFGFEQELAIELGYGKAIHHVLRLIAETTRQRGRALLINETEAIINSEFYLPYADNPTFIRMSRAATMLTKRYLDEYADDFKRIWAIEKPFEVNFDDGTVSGRADLILDEELGTNGNLAVVDYKAANDVSRDERYAMQLAVYAYAARTEGLNVVVGYLHDLSESKRRNVDVSEMSGNKALNTLENSVKSIRKGIFNAKPDPIRCVRCDFRLICTYNIASLENI